MSRPIETVHALVGLGVTHVVGIPDNTSGPLFDELAAHPSLRLVTVTREGEAMAIAAGLWLGGASPLVLIQNTGLLESGDALRGTVLRMGAPILAAGREPTAPRTNELLTRPDVDTTALLTEPTLDAWGVPHARCLGPDDPPTAIRALVDRTREEDRCCALVVARPLP